MGLVGKCCGDVERSMGEGVGKCVGVWGPNTCTFTHTSPNLPHTFHTFPYSPHTPTHAPIPTLSHISPGHFVHPYTPTHFPTTLSRLPPTHFPTHLSYISLYSTHTQYTFLHISSHFPTFFPTFSKYREFIM